MSRAPTSRFCVCIRNSLARLAAAGIDLTGGRVELITLPRIAGYLFKPVSFYYCYDRAGTPVAALAEVTNTFHHLMWS